jgi:ABC-type transporter Mla subunit MlaD
LLDSVVGNLSQVASDLANLIGANKSTITNTIDNLGVVASDIQSHQQDLAQSLSTLGQGLAPYIQISQWGQWFAVQTVYTCLANQTVCAYYEPNNPPAGSGPLGSPPSTNPLSSSPSSAAPASGSGSVAASTLGQDLQAVSGAAAAPTTGGLP